MEQKIERVKSVWQKFRESKSGWAVIVTLFALLFALLATVLTGILGLPWLLEENSPSVDLALGIIFPVVTLGLTVMLARYIAKKSRLETFKLLGWKKSKRNVLWLVPVITIVYVVVMVISLSVLQVFSPELAEQEQEVAATVSSLGGWRLLVMIASVGILTPIAEETFFRGLILSLYSKKLRFPIAILFSAVLFAVAHGQVNVGIDTLVFGIALGVLTWKTESIYPAIGLHILKNCLALSVILS